MLLSSVYMKVMITMVNNTTHLLRDAAPPDSGAPSRPSMPAAPLSRFTLQPPSAHRPRGAMRLQQYVE